MDKDTTADHAASIDADAKIRNFKTRASMAEGKYKTILEKYEQLQAEFEAFSQIKEVSTFELPKYPSAASECTAVCLASDWHIEERVEAATVNGLNDFTLDVAKKRAALFFANTAKLITGKQKATKIKTLILALLGDYLSGYIHEELIETAQLPPIEAALMAQSFIASGIKYLLANTNVNLVIPCHSGNHGRTTRKVHHATERGNSLEFFIYKSLAEHFQGEKRIKFLIAAGYHSFVEVVPGFKIRFHHGHAVKYGGGVGGITIPVNKAIAQWNKSENVQLDAFGHFHQFIFGGNFICNSSLIGFNAFAIAIKASYERPRQAFFLVNHKRKELTDICPIWLD